MKTYYKALRAGLKSQYNGFQWKIGKWHKTECVELCHGFNCSDRIVDTMKYVNMEILAEVQCKGKYFIDTDKSTWEQMRIVKAWHWKKEDSVKLAIYAAELVIDIFETKYPNNDSPIKAIEAAKECLKNPNAADVARSAARDAANTARAAASAASAASDAAMDVHAVMRAAVFAAARATRDDILNKIEKWIRNHIKELEEYK